MICWYLGGGSYPVTESFRIGADFGPEICIFKYNLGSLISPMPKNGIQIHTDIFSEYNVVCPNGLITKIPQILYEF